MRKLTTELTEEIVRADLIQGVMVIDSLYGPNYPEEHLLMRRHLIAVIKYYCEPERFEKLGITEI